MRIQHLKISNILGVDDLEFDAGRFNEVVGTNGVGKTSVLEAVKAALGQGHDATLLRRGAEHGEIVLVLDDGAAVRRRIGAATSNTTVRDASGKIVAKPATVLAGLVDAMSVNPVEFLAASKKDRARVLLEAMPISVDAQRLTAITGIQVNGGRGLDAVDAARQQVFAARTDTNRAIRDKKAAVEQLQAAMPSAPGGVEGDEGSLQAQIDAATAARDAEYKRIDTKLAGLDAAAADAEQRVKADLQIAIDALRADAQARIDAARARHAAVRDAAGQQREATTRRHADATTPLRVAQHAVAANRDAAAKRRVALETIATLGAEIATLEAEASSQTKALDAVDAYKAELLAALPIPGIEIVDGDVVRNGVVFDRLNTAQRVGIAVDIARLRAGAMNVVCVDGLELLSAANYEEFRRQALASGLQMFVSRVNDDAAMSVSVFD